MKPINNIFIASQKEPILSPYCYVEIAPYGHPQPQSRYQFQWFEWTKLYETDTISPGPHGITIPGDGSVIRVRLSGNVDPVYFMVQRKTNPGSSTNWSTGWLQRNRVYYFTNGNNLAIASYDTEVTVFFIGDSSGNIWQRISTDYGATWGTGAVITAGWQGRYCLAGAYKDLTNKVVVYSDTSDYTLKVAKWNGSAWTNYVSSINNVYGCAVFYEGDFNIIILRLDGTFLRLARVVFGDGYRQSLHTFSSYEYLDTPSAHVNIWEIVNNYLENLPAGTDYNKARHDLLEKLLRRVELPSTPTTSPSPPTYTQPTIPQPGPRTNIYDPYRIPQRRRTS